MTVGGTNIETSEDGRIIVGGLFNRVNGSRRDGIAEVTPDGKVTAFRAPIASSSTVTDVAIGGSRVYVTGVLSVRSRGTVVDRSAIATSKSGRLLDWRPSPAGRFGALQVERFGDWIVLGGDFRSVQGKERRGLAAFTLGGSLTGWAPRLGGSDAGAAALAASESALCVLGSFSRVNSVRRVNAAAVDSSGRPTEWKVEFPSLDLSGPVAAAGGNRVLVSWARITDARTK